MNELDQIRIAHRVERDLATLAGTIPGGGMKDEVSAALNKWQDLSHRLTAALCGLGPEPGVTTPRRGRPRKLRSENSEPVGASGDGAGAVP